MLRRATALLLAVLSTYSVSESVLGAAHDGAVHHESDATAVQHQLEGRASHGQEDSAPQGGEHRHGGAADHCSHQHGVALTASSVRVHLAFEQAASPLAERAVSIAHAVDAPFHPPRV
jgi:hypothetical protein